MKVGSLVECVDASPGRDEIVKPTIKGAVYTIRDLYYDNVMQEWGVRLEEIINPIDPIWEMELGYFMWRFREIQPPMDLSFINELQKESVC